MIMNLFIFSLLELLTQSVEECSTRYNNNLNCNQVYYDKHYINVNDLSTKHIFNFKNIKDSFLELYTLSMIGQLNIVLVMVNQIRASKC